MPPALTAVDDRAGGQLGGGRVRRVRFHDDRASGRQRGGRVASRNGERQREVARPEHGDRADRNQHPADVRLRQRLAIGNRAVDAGVHPRALANQVREHPQLSGGACALAGQTLGGQRGLDVRHVHQIPDVLDLLGDAIQKSARAARRTAGGIRATRARPLRARDRRARRTLPRIAAMRAAGGEAPVGRIDRLAGNQVLSRQHRATTSPATCRRPSRAVRHSEEPAPLRDRPARSPPGPADTAGHRVSYITRRAGEVAGETATPTAAGPSRCPTRGSGCRRRRRTRGRTRSRRAR